MAENTFQVSSKLPDGRIFVIGGDTFENFAKNVGAIMGAVPAEELLSTMASSLEGSSAATAAPSAPTPTVPNGFSPAPSAPASSGKVCKHGEMTKRTGSGPKGPWKAFMCPSPKGTPDQCEPVWIRRNDAEWATF
jgi:hypothetical protein